jgi:SulP family sulfate permease
MLFNLIGRFKSNGITLGFSGLKKQVREVMDRTNLSQSIGIENLFTNDQDAFDQLYLRGAIDARIDRPEPANSSVATASA